MLDSAHSGLPSLVLAFSNRLFRSFFIYFIVFRNFKSRKKCQCERNLFNANICSRMCVCLFVSIDSSIIVVATIIVFISFAFLVIYCVSFSFRLVFQECINKIAHTHATRQTKEKTERNEIYQSSNLFG